MLIDAHQHLWTLGENGCRWPTPELAPIYRSYGLADLEAVAAACGVTGTVLVQSQPDDADTDWLLKIAEASPRVLAVVGWADLASPGAPARVRQLAGAPKLRGLRPMLQALPQDDWIADRALDPAVAAMADAGLSLDALVFSRHLPHLLTFARRWPQLPIVIDHAAKPPIAAGQFDSSWAERIAQLAALPQVFCKLSGLLTEGSDRQGERELAPWVAHLIACFGPDRLMWGSDWPVVELRTGYGEWLAMAQRLVEQGGGDAGQVFAAAARRFYRIGGH